MRRILALALLAVGTALLVWGLQSTDSIASTFHRFFTGTPTEKAIWLLGGGIVALTVGFGLLATRRSVET